MTDAEWREKHQQARTEAERGYRALQHVSAEVAALVYQLRMQEFNREVAANDHHRA